jgi:hypothetical protein
MRRRYRELGDTRMVRRLGAAPVTEQTIPLHASYYAVRDRAMHRLGIGTTRDMRSVVTGLFLPSLRSPDYTPREKVNLWRGKLFTRHSGLWNEMLATVDRARAEAESHLFHGRHDYTVPMQSRHLSDSAPVKGFYTRGPCALPMLRA